MTACGAWAALRGSMPPSFWSVRDIWRSSRSASRTSSAARTGGWSSCAARPGSAKRRSCAPSAALCPGRCGRCGPRVTHCSPRAHWGRCWTSRAPPTATCRRTWIAVPSPMMSLRRCCPSSSPRARPSWSWRTCTGPTRRHSTSCGSSAGAWARCRCCSPSPIATSRCTGPIRCGRCSVSWPAPGPCAGWSWAGSRVTRSRRSRAIPPSIPTCSTSVPRATRSSSPRRWPLTPTACPPPSATRCWPGRRDSARPPAPPSTPSRSCPSGQRCGCSRR